VHCGKPEIPAVVVDAAEMVPWQDVMCVVNLAKREKIERIEFAGRK
jgi:biopolymer transport protein ExbD